MKKILLFVLLIVSQLAFGQNVEVLNREKVQKLEPGKFEYVNISVNNALVIEEKSEVFIDISTTDVPSEELDSVVVTIGDDRFLMNQLSPFMIHDLDKSAGVEVMMFKGQDTLDFISTGSQSLSMKVDRKERPLFPKDTSVFGILAVMLALIFYTSHIGKGVWKKFYAIVPALLLCYLIPAILVALGLISKDYSGLYTMAKNYLLPGALILMTLGIDFKAILNLGPKALIMFGTATLGIVLGGPIAVWVYSFIDPEVVGGVGNDATWRGFATLAGSWIGGGANQTAMLEMYEYNQELYGKMITVDIVVAQLWMIFLLWAAARADKFDKWLKADTSAIDDLKNRMIDYQAQNKKVPTLTDYMIILGLTFGLVGVSHLIGGYLAPICEEKWGESNPLSSQFFWLVVLVTIGGLLFSLTKLKKYEGAGASKIGSLFIYILVATIGMKMDLAKAVEEPQLILVGVIWMMVHVGLLFLVAKLIRAPFFFLAVGSKANVGGAASAPVVAAAFHPSLASVGALLAVLGYAIGSVAAMLCAEMMGAIAP